MRLYQKLLAIGTTTLVLSELTGCLEKDNSNDKSEPEAKPFAQIPMFGESMALTSGDFDRDGNLDFIVGVYDGYGHGKLFYFKGDGRGNFSQK